jgi:hypothetical protein
MFLDTADLRARRRQTMRLADWEVVLDGFPRSNELRSLKNAGRVSAAQAEKIAAERCEAFDAQRNERIAAGERSDISELERIVKRVSTRQVGGESDEK